MAPKTTIITYSGEASVFESVRTSIEKGLTCDGVEWKRSHMRSTKYVNICPEFVPLESIQVPDKSDGRTQSLLTTAMLHTYWTDCSDVEVYKSTTKDVIQQWINGIKNHSSKEWLIILVETESKKTNKLLPRSSVLDKIKSDFAQKQNERCISLSDPSRMDSKLADSLQNLSARMKQLLLNSYGKSLMRFEENMRAQREKRNENGWNFCNYFLLQEELAFMLEMLGVYDEALVQYDELDALFTQFVLNSHLTDTPQWLLSFQRHGDSWPALNLNPDIETAQNNIKNSKISLLAFRNYLFARQATLLIKQKRINDLVERSIGFLRNCINELNILEVTFSEEGSLDCWAFVSCLEILATISDGGERLKKELNSTVCNKSSDDAGNQAAKPDGMTQQKATSQYHQWAGSNFSTHTAYLWDYARQKLYSLGDLGGLLPKSKPKSDHLHKVLSLAAGLENTSYSVESPINKLKTALSDKQSFHSHYLDLCELSMGTYKHIGRLRSAKKVGLSLASYYIDKEDYSKAISFLIDALKTFSQEKWDVLTIHVQLKLAHCYKAMKDIPKFVETCALLSSCQKLPYDKRIYHFEQFKEFIGMLKQPKASLIMLDPVILNVESVTVKTSGKLSDPELCNVDIYVRVRSGFPQSIESSTVKLSLSREASNDSGKKNNNRNHTPQKPLIESDKDLMQNELRFGQLFENKMDKGASQTGKIRCHNSHQILRRKDSHVVKADPVSLKADFSLNACSEDVVIFQPGANEIVLSTKISHSGRYRLDQLSVNVEDHVEILGLIENQVTFDVVKVESQIELENAEPLVAGIEQTIILSIKTGSFKIEEDMMLTIRSTSMDLLLRQNSKDDYSKEITKQCGQASPFSTCKISFIVKVSLAPQKDNAPIEKKILIRCPWASDEKKISLLFCAPFMSTHKIHTVKERKFLQILLQGLLPNVEFKTYQHKLVVTQNDAKSIPLVPLNPASQVLSLTYNGTASYMYEMGMSEYPDNQQLRLEFSVYFEKNEENVPKKLFEFNRPELYKHYICLNKFKTLFLVNAEVGPHKGNEFCRVNIMSSLVLKVNAIDHVENSSDFYSLMYDIRADQHFWAICGKSSGVFSLKPGETEEITLEVMPMSAGYLPLPGVHLSKYIPANTPSTVPSVVPFSSGQVYNGSKAMQVHVLPPAPQISAVGATGPATNEAHF